MPQVTPIASAPAYPVRQFSWARDLLPPPGQDQAGAFSFLKHAAMVSARHSVIAGGC